MTLLAFERVQSEDANRRRTRAERAADPRHAELMEAAQQEQPQDASEYLRQRAERLKTKGR